MTETTDFDLVVMAEVDCASCGVRFGLPSQLLDKRHSDHDLFYCPNGHSLSYPQPPKERDIELEELRSSMKVAQDELAAERAAHQQTKASRRPLFRSRR